MQNNAYRNDLCVKDIEASSNPANVGLFPMNFFKAINKKGIIGKK